MRARSLNGWSGGIIEDTLLNFTLLFLELLFLSIANMYHEILDLRYLKSNALYQCLVFVLMDSQFLELRRAPENEPA